MSTMEKRIPLKSGDEYDALTQARKSYKYLARAGVASRVKRRYRRRFRRTLNMEIKNGPVHYCYD